MSLVKWILVLGLVGGCASEQVTRARVEADEDKFCAAVASARVLEKETKTLPVDAGAE
jgi:hypothetical protein